MISESGTECCASEDAKSPKEVNCEIQTLFIRV